VRLGSLKSWLSQSWTCHSSTPFGLAVSISPVPDGLGRHSQVPCGLSPKVRTVRVL
jgi:hypothetical protein